MTTIPRGMAMVPLTPADISDFLYTYFKAEYAPIRSFFSTATAEPRHASRWTAMGTELSPSVFRPANAQAQKDLESLDDYLRAHNLDATFIRGLVIRYARFDIHERLEKKLYESCREDLMVRKALKEKHVIDAIWPAQQKYPVDHVQQGQKVRGWYGDMFAKYFRYLHSLDDYKLRPEVEDRIRRASCLHLVPYVDHLVFGPIEPILPMAAKGAAVQPKTSKGGDGLEGVRPEGRADRFEIRFDAPPFLSETQTRSVMRTTECLKCGTKRDVTVVISIDPTPGPVEKRHAHSQSHGALSNTSAPLARRSLSSSKAAAKYSPSSGYEGPASEEKKEEQPHHQGRYVPAVPSEPQLFPYSDLIEPPTQPTEKQEEKPSTEPTRPSARNSLSMNLLNLKWPRSSTSTPLQPSTAAPPSHPKQKEQSQPEMKQLTEPIPSSPPPTYSAEPSLNRAPSPNLLLLSPPPTSLLDSAVPSSSAVHIEDDAAAFWGEMQAGKVDDEEEEEMERRRARAMISPINMEGLGEENVWGRD